MTMIMEWVEHCWPGECPWALGTGIVCKRAMLRVEQHEHLVNVSRLWLVATLSDGSLCMHAASTPCQDDWL